MDLRSVLPSFLNEMEKISRSGAAGSQARDHAADANEHFKTKDWATFEKLLKAKGFQQAVVKHSDADSKLKRYVKNYGGYLNSKDQVGVVPSRTGDKMYVIKKLPNGRLGCDCKDWQYVHSVRKTDCDHIEELKEGMQKSSGALFELSRGVAAARSIDRSKKNARKGKAVQSYYTALNGGNY